MADSTEAAKPAEANGWGGVTSAGSMLVVDIGKKQKKKKRISDLRKGRGKLFDKIAEMVEEMKSSGTIKDDVQPLVIVVREKERRLLQW